MKPAEITSPVEPDPWCSLMRRGEMAAAWEISDAVLRARGGAPCWHWPRHQQYIWDGTPLAGKRVLIRCYHGLGDTVQFIRYARYIKRLAREVIVWAQPPLLPLLATCEGIDQLLPLHDGSPDVAYDVDVESMELPHVFRSTLATLPPHVPYLHPRPGVSHTSALRRDHRLKVGLVWAAGAWDDRRSVPFDKLGPLLRVPDVCWHVLQQGPARQAWRGSGGVMIRGDAPEETAAVMRALDLVISIDSFPAHLAGALAVPVWTLLHAEPDWRWMNDRSDSPWYPTMRLYRQAKAGDWDPVIEHVTCELRRCSTAGWLNFHQEQGKRAYI